MQIDIEQVKDKIAEAIKKRIYAVNRSRAKYHLWFDLKTREIGCGWAVNLRLKDWQPIVYTFMRNPNDGFTASEWNEMAERFMPYFLMDEPKDEV